MIDIRNYIKQYNDLRQQVLSAVRDRLQHVTTTDFRDNCLDVSLYRRLKLNNDDKELTNVRLETLIKLLCKIDDVIVHRHGKEGKKIKSA